MCATEQDNFTAQAPAKPGANPTWSSSDKEMVGCTLGRRDYTRCISTGLTVAKHDRWLNGYSDEWRFHRRNGLCRGLPGLL